MLCTANVCRSPMAAAVLRAALEHARIDAGIESAGFGFEDDAPPAGSVALLAERGIDLHAHRSRRLLPAQLATADLVLVMERSHVRNVATLDASAWPRTFTLKEFVRRAAPVGPRPPETPLREWVARVHAGRSVDDLLGASAVDDIDDPDGRSMRGYERVLTEIDDVIARLVTLCWPVAAARATSV